MPANLKDLRTRIRSVRNTEQITKAMKLVSTAKFGKAQIAVTQAKPYVKALVDMVRDVAGSINDDFEHPLLQTQDANVVALVVISSERGLCGSYNSNNAKMAMRTVHELEEKGKQVAIICLGKKAHQMLSRQLRPRGYNSDQVSLQDVEKNPDLCAEAKVVRLITTTFDKKVQPFAEVISKAFNTVFCAAKISQVKFVFTRFETVGSLPIVAEEVLPISKLSQSEKAKIVEPLFEPSATELLALLLPRYLTMSIQQSLIEAIASEHCARMAAMENATRNAKEMLRKLQVTYQRARQAAITRELIEIISGAEAL